jgi:transcriptional regulator with XRE-family HTH domain
MSLDKIIFELQDRNASMIARACGLRVGTVCDIRNGKQKNPSYRTIQKLTAYLEAVASEPRT